jgi:glycerophosphoryl diester phosphodiesterase
MMNDRGHGDSLSGGWRARRRGRARPFVIGHRGFASRFPENTLLSFREALAAGADGVECDVQKTADGCYVVLHDPTLERVSRSAAAVSALTLRELESIDVGAGERVPELSKLAALLPKGKLLDCELKKETLTESDCPKILAILASRIDGQNIMISSFEPALLFPFAKSGVTIGLLLGTEAASLGLARLVLLLIRLRPRFINLPIQAYGVLSEGRMRLFLRILRLLGFSVLFWTLDREEEIRKVRRFSRAIVTNNVDAAIRAIAKE